MDRFIEGQRLYHPKKGEYFFQEALGVCLTFQIWGIIVLEQAVI